MLPSMFSMRILIADTNPIASGDHIAVIFGTPLPMILRESTLDSPSLYPQYSVIGPAYIHDLASAQALHGPIPSRYQSLLATRYFRDTTVRIWLWFRDVTTGERFPEDPRLGEILEEWELGIDFQEGELKWYRNKRTGLTSWEPCDELDELIKKGVDVREIVLI